LKYKWHDKEKNNMIKYKESVKLKRKDKKKLVSYKIYIFSYLFYDLKGFDYKTLFVLYRV